MQNKQKMKTHYSELLEDFLIKEGYQYFGNNEKSNFILEKSKIPLTITQLIKNPPCKIIIIIQEKLKTLSGTIKITIPDWLKIY